MKPTKKEKELYAVLLGAEALIEKLDPQEKSESLMKVYRFIHGFNKKHSCFSFHYDWREEFKGFIEK